MSLDYFNAVIQAFKRHEAYGKIQGVKGRKHRHVNMATDGQRIYSYEMPIAGYGIDGVIETLYDRRSPSRTTSNHLSNLRGLRGRHGRQVDALGCPECPKCHGRHTLWDNGTCELISGLHYARVNRAKAKRLGYLPTHWQAGSAKKLNKLGLGVVLAPRFIWSTKVVPSNCCWVAPMIHAVITMPVGLTARMRLLGRMTSDPDRIVPAIKAVLESRVEITEDALPGLFGRD